MKTIEIRIGSKAYTIERVEYEKQVDAQDSGVMIFPAELNVFTSGSKHPIGFYGEMATEIHEMICSAKNGFYKLL